MKTKMLKQEIVFKASPKEVYEALMDSKKHTKFTGAKAVISKKTGGKFSAYDGWITGKNIFLAPNKKIVQLWRGDDWPVKCYSKVIFSFKEVKGGTKLSFVHKDIPEEFYKDINEGWKEYYWKAMKKIFKW